MKYKFAFDLGSTSCGWAVVNTDEDGNVVGLADMGVRIFPDGRDAQSKEPLQVARRNARGARVRNDRILQRRHKIIDLLKENGMIYDRSDERENPYKLRSDAVDKEITLKQFGRIMYNLSLRRGFKSNRKEDKDSKGKTKQAMKNLENALEGQTLGQYLWKKFSENKAKENIKIDGKKQKINHTRFADNEYDNKGNLNKDALYPSREMYEDEFDRIWSKQAEFHSILTDELKGKFYNAIFFQRPLKPQQRGFCMFEDGELRIYKAHPLFQRFRALQTINQMEIDYKPLTEEQRKALKKELFEEFKSKNTKAGTVSFANIRNILGLKKGVKINLEKKGDGEKERDNIYADKTAFLMSRDERFGQKWFDLSADDQESIVEMLIGDAEDEAVKQFLQEHYNLDDEQCNAIMNAPLEEGTGSLSKKAIEKILPFLEEGQLYNDACKSAGYHHSWFDGDVEMLDELPYYGEVLKKSCVQDKDGNYRITNISVHVALNQLRLVVNELIKKYGNPDFVAVEIARDLKMGTEELAKANKQQTKNKNENDRIAEEIRKLGIQKPSREDIQKYKLWEMLSKDPLQRRCVYSGRQIAVGDLFNGTVEIEHILPFARTFDDSIFNKTLSYKGANDYKGNRSPYEAFGESKDGYNWDEIMERVANLPKPTQWRFNKNAMQKVEEYLEKFGLKDIIARQLNDTKYMSRLAVQYLKHICKAEYYTDEEGKEHRKNNCYGLPGTMTDFFRKGWGVNWLKDKSNKEGYRSSHAHHAVDAFVVACMTRKQLQKLAENADWIEKYGKNLDEKARFRRLFHGLMPYETFNNGDDVKKLCDKMPISFKPKLKNPKQENSTVGALHDETAYSLLEFKKGLNGVFVKREDVENLVLKDLPNIIDTQAEKLIEQYGATEEAFNKFKEYCEKNGIKKIRCKSVADVSTYIPVFRTKEDRDEYHKAYEDWFVFEGRSPANETEEQKQERERKQQQLLEIVQQKALKAYKWFVGGNNFCADVYQISPRDKVYTDKKEQGSWQVEVVSNYMATLNKGQALWRKKHPTARLVMRLKIDDMVMGENFTKEEAEQKLQQEIEKWEKSKEMEKYKEKLTKWEKTHEGQEPKKPEKPKSINEIIIEKCNKEKTSSTSFLFRVKKISSAGCIYIRPDFITKEESDKKSVCLSASSYQKYKIRKVFVSPAGKLVDNGFSDKWNDTKCD